MKQLFFDDIVAELLMCKSKKEVEEFLRGILTSKEPQEISVRLRIVKMLKAGVPQHTIAEKLGVGIATVTRGSKELLLGRFKTTAPSASWR